MAINLSQELLTGAMQLPRAGRADLAAALIEGFDVDATPMAAISEFRTSPARRPEEPLTGGLRSYRAATPCRRRRDDPEASLTRPGGAPSSRPPVLGTRLAPPPGASAAQAGGLDRQAVRAR